MLGMAAQDPVVFGLNGSLFLSFGLAAVAGIRAPLRYCSVLLMELAYKVHLASWRSRPTRGAGRISRSALVQVVIFVTFIAGDLVAIPFSIHVRGDVAGLLRLQEGAALTSGWGGLRDVASCLAR